jgi:sterol desaturase/sphingolipid hydroxylase (fatty acid hydroxylase superfamily)
MLNDYLILLSVFDYHSLWPTLLPETWVALLLLASFSLLAAAEYHAPREKLSKKNLKQSYLTNMGLFLINSVVMSLLSVTSLFVLAKHYADRGLLSGLPSPALKALLSLLALDLMLYAWHRACHRYDCLWMFHKVHHSDPTLNVTTAFRAHFLEVLLTNGFKAVCIIAVGIEEIWVLASEAVTTLFIMFHHTNISFKSETWLGKVVIVPYLHRAHHSTLRREHDNNYGAVLSVWDSLFGSRIEASPAAIGIKGYAPPGVMGLSRYGLTMAAPVPKAITAATSDAIAIQPAVLEHMIAEAAYYKAEKRGFSPGGDINDWLEAKKDIITKLYGIKPMANNTAGHFSQAAQQM